MRKFLLFGLVAAAGIATATTVNLKDALSELNTAVDQLIAPIRNSQTTARIHFNDIQTDSARAITLVVEGNYAKVGTHNTLSIRLDNFSYDYNQGHQPIASLAGFVGLDITKLLGQEQLNKIIPELENFFKEAANNVTADYGQAAVVSLKISDKIQDEAGNYTGLTGRFVATIDLDKLPQSQKREDVMFTELSATVAVDLKTGADVELMVILNPEYKTFRVEELGLKEALDKLLSKDKQELEDIRRMFVDLDVKAENIVSGRGL